MQQVTTTLFMLGVISYSAALTLFTIDLARREPSPIAVRWAPRMLGVAVVLHASHVIVVSLLTRSCPVGSVHFALSVVALVAALGYLLLRRRPSLHAIGALVTPTALALLVASQFVGKEKPVGALNRSLLTFHVSANLMGLSMFLLAATAGVLYIVQERRLRAKRVGSGQSKLPPLEVLDKTVHRLLLVGFPLLTLGLVTGAVFAGQVAQASGISLLRAVLAYAGWLMVAAVLVLRQLAGWRGRRAAYGAILGALFILIVIGLYVTTPSLGGGL
jgi:ABC-type uncharacterized transport system permease subunit